MSVCRAQTMNYAVSLWCISTLRFLCSKTGIYRELKLAEHKIAEANTIQITCYLRLFLSLTVNFKYCGYVEFVLKHNIYRWWGEKPHCRAIFASFICGHLPQVWQATTAICNIQHHINFRKISWCSRILEVKFWSMLQGWIGVRRILSLQECSNKTRILGHPLKKKKKKHVIVLGICSHVPLRCS